MCSAHGEMKERGRDLIRSDPAGGGGLEGQCPDSHCCPMGVWAHGPLEFRPGSLLQLTILARPVPAPWLGTTELGLLLLITEKEKDTWKGLC